MARQLSTSVSDFALACSVFYVAYQLYYSSYIYAAVGLLIQGVAACFGVVRFGLQEPEKTPIFRCHKFMSWLAAAAGMAFIAFQFCIKYQWPMLGNIVIGFSVLVVTMSQFQNTQDQQLYTQACSGLAVLSSLLLCFGNSNWNGTFAALVYILAGAIIGSDGQLLGILRVDLLHYALIIGNILFLKAFS